MHIKRALEQIGYNANEVKVYLSVLEGGELIVADIAKHTGLPRSSVQLIVQHLHSKQVLNKYYRRGKQVWVAENPELLLLDLEEKQKVLRSVLPKLQELRHEIKQKPEIKCLSGSSELQTAFNDVIHAHYPVFMIGSISSLMFHFGEETIQTFFDRLLGQQVPVKIITDNTSGAQNLREIFVPTKHHMRFCDDERLLNTAYIIYDGHVLIILLNHEISGIISRDEDLSKATSLLFDTLWNQVGSRD